MNEMTKISHLDAPAQAFLSRAGKMLIDGKWVAAASGKTFDAIDPATEGVICQIAAGDSQDVDRAVKAARKAFEDSDWSRMRPVERERLLLRLADLVEANAEELAQLESLDNGKLVFFARIVDVQGTVDFFRYMAGWATKIEGKTLDVSLGMPGEEYAAFTLRQPVGVVGQIIPWNFPLAMATWKLAPALAVGCTVVLKPAEQTSLTALRLGELILEAGFPAGVVNIVTGFGETAGASLTQHPDVDKIAFTGSTSVGKLIGKTAMDTMKRVSLELGGKSPVIVAGDADPAVAAAGAANAIFFNSGQVCTAGSRLYVEHNIYDQVVSGLAAAASATKLGPGYDPESQMGPVVSSEQLDRVLGYIEQGKAEGGEVVAGGARQGNQGYFVQPTVFAGLGPDSALIREEIFGPVVVATPFKSVDEIAAVANDTTYGLAASIWTQDLSLAHRLARRIKAGTVWVNTHNVVDPNLPFGGMKQSGLGRENGAAAIETYTELKTVVMKVA
jgi:phenylacetaldehyde dehydrogenase